MKLNRISRIIISILIPVCLTAGFWVSSPEIAMGTMIGLLFAWSLLIQKTENVIAFSLAVIASVVACVLFSGVFGTFLAFAVLLYFGVRYFEPEHRGFFHAMLFATIGYAMFSVIDRSGLIWNESSKLSWFISHEFIYKDGRPELLGSFELGLVPVLFSVLLLTSRLFFFRASIFDHLFFALALFVATLFSLLLQQQYLLLFFPAFLAFSKAFDLSHVKAPQSKPAARWAGIGFAVTAIAFMTMFAMRGTGTASEGVRNIYVLDGGLKSLEQPDAIDFEGGDSGALFGGFCRLIECNDWNCDIVPQTVLDKELNPDHVDLMVIINPTETFSRAQQDVLTKYVSNGGRMMVLGDHTDIGGVMRPLNQSLSMTSIKFNFDSAIPIDQYSQWRRSLRGATHPVFKNARNCDTGISVGASLDCTGNSRILVQAIAGYSDTGRPDFGVSRLGDMRYNPGEEAGDLALVAEESVGKGIVQVWGDTSGFQDGRLFLTAGFMSRNIAWLTDYHGRELLPRRLAAVLISLSLFASVFFASKRPAMLLTILSLVVVSVALIHQACNFSYNWKVNERTVVFDDSHMARYPGEAFEKGYSRLYELCMRSGFYLRRSENFNSISGMPAAWIINSPVESYSGSEAEKLRDYVEAGGNLIVVTGSDDFSNVELILQPDHLSLASSPYGSAHNSRMLVDEWRDFILPEEEEIKIKDESELQDESESNSDETSVAAVETQMNTETKAVQTETRSGPTNANVIVKAPAKTETVLQVVENQTRQDTANVDPESDVNRELSENEKLASVANDEEKRFVAYDADISFRESYPVVINRESDDLDVLVNCWERPLIVRKRLGAGQIHLVADPRFLLDENLEFGSSGNKRLNVKNGKLIVKCLEK